MKITYLPLPKGGRKKKAGSILGRIGAYSRPFIKQILRLGVDQLKNKAIAKIKTAGNNLTNIATMKKPSREGGYIGEPLPDSIIHPPSDVQVRSIDTIKVRKKKKKRKKNDKKTIKIKKKIKKKLGSLKNQLGSLKNQLGNERKPESAKSQQGKLGKLGKLRKLVN